MKTKPSFKTNFASNAISGTFTIPVSDASYISQPLVATDPINDAMKFSAHIKSDKDSDWEWHETSVNIGKQFDFNNKYYMIFKNKVEVYTYAAPFSLVVDLIDGQKNPKSEICIEGRKEMLEFLREELTEEEYYTIEKYLFETYT